MANLNAEDKENNVNVTSSDVDTDSGDDERDSDDADIEEPAKGPVFIDAGKIRFVMNSQLGAYIHFCLYYMV